MTNGTFNLLSRRGFLGGASAFTLAGCTCGRFPGFVPSGKPDLVFGVISDIHITTWESTEIFRKTLRWFRDRGVDAVMIVGDIADHGILPQLENAAKAWYEVFPDDKAPDGRHVEKLFVTGNHDPEGLRYRDWAMDAAFAPHHLTYEEAEKLTLPAVGMEKAWKQCFHEDYAPIYRKNVKGFDFVGAHWDTWCGVNGLEDWFKANAAKIDTGKPFFYFQHPHPRNTVYGPWAWGADNGQSVRALSPYANAVAFSGHSHAPLTDERSVWRGAFTSVGTASLSYVSLYDSRENANTINPRTRAGLNTDRSVRQGQIASVYGDCIVLERRDFVRDVELDAPWVFELPTKASSFAARAAKAVAPEFPVGAKVVVTQGTFPNIDRNDEIEKNEKGEPVTEERVCLTFPAAIASKGRVFDYDIIAKKRSGDVEQVWRQMRQFSPTVMLARCEDRRHPTVTYRLPKNWFLWAKELKFEVTPLDSYGVRGKTIASDWERIG